jgi:hypothetical protein
MNKKGMNFDFPIIGTLIIVIAILGGILYVVGFHYQTGQGEHTGTIVATENTGVFFKTDRLYFKTDVQSSQEDSYCVIDKSLMPKLRELQTSKEKVTIKYISYFANGITNCAGESAVVTGVK